MTVDILVHPDIAPYGPPTYATTGSAGVDLRSRQAEFIGPGEISVLKTGISLQLPHGYEAQIRSRSGLAMKHGVHVLNSPGTIDSDYRDEIGVILHNAGQEHFVVNVGDRIAQMVIAPVTTVEWHAVIKLEETNRSGGFGSTGTR